ncbi:MAG: response regulator transcription factor [Chloroflexaceae bacterium]|jgi:DNA-binding NarL/FixJ family response regulator|nr:response regulator transcription factor [Chloroflexaceae bacterium]
MAVIRVVLADDHALVLEGLRTLLDAEDDIEVIGTASDGSRALDVIRAMQPDVAVLDLQMPVMDGLACLEHIRAEGLATKVLVLSAFNDGDSMQSALEHEADGFALKTEPPQQTIACIRQVYRGQLVFPQAAKRWLRTHRQRPSPSSADLSEREAEVLSLVAQGLTNTQIAVRLNVSDNTVKFHLQNIYQKLDVSNRTEAAGVFYKLRQEGKG